jgi:hypothetical protein
VPVRPKAYRQSMKILVIIAFALLHAEADVRKSLIRTAKKASNYDALTKVNIDADGVVMPLKSVTTKHQSHKRRLAIEGIILPPSHAHKSSVSWKMMKDGALVEFEHNGTQYRFELKHESVYAKAAKITVFDGDVTRQIDLPGNSFVGRKDGSWANAYLHPNGAVSGLFQTGSHVIELQPEQAEASLIELQTGGRLHSSRMFHFEEVMGQTVPTLKDFQSDTPPTVDFGSKIKNPARKPLDFPRLKVAVDNETLMVDPNSTGRNERANKLEEQRLLNSPGPDLDPWDDAKMRSFGKGRCYPNDDQPHEFHLSLQGDYKACQEKGEELLRKSIEQAILFSSYIFERQFNVKFVIDDLKLWCGNVSKDAPSYISTCNVDEEFIRDEDERRTRTDAVNSKLTDMFYDYHGPEVAALHIFTGCGNNTLVAGTAFFGGACFERMGYGVSRINAGGRNDNMVPWRLFAHELGHNFAADHPFQYKIKCDGNGNTGCGLMDYKDGRLDGVHQFDNSFNRKNMCKRMTQIVSSCKCKFKPAEWFTSNATCTEVWADRPSDEIEMPNV